MPRLIRKVPAYRLHRKSGQAVVNLNGRRFNLGKYDTQASRIAYDRLVAEWLSRGRAPVFADEDSPTVTELIAQYWEFAKGYYRKDGIATGELPCIRAALKPVRSLYGTLPVDAFDGADLEAVRAHMIRLGWARGTINKHINRVRRCFRWGVPKKLVPAELIVSLNAVAGLREGRSEAKETEPVAPVSDADVEKTLPFLGAAVMDMVMFQRFTGCRPGEVCQLRPSDIDTTGDVWLYTPASHKTSHHGKRRVIPIGARAQEVVRKYLDRPANAYCFCPQDAKPGTGDRYNSNAYQRCVRRAARRAGVPEWTPNQLRHAAATQIRQRFGLEAAQVVLGHSAANVTQVYAERDLAKALEVARQIG